MLSCRLSNGLESLVNDFALYPFLRHKPRKLVFLFVEEERRGMLPVDLAAGGINFCNLATECEGLGALLNSLLISCFVCYFLPHL